MNEHELKYAIAAAKEALSHMINRRRWLKNAVVANESYRRTLISRYRIDILDLTNEIGKMQGRLFKLQHGA